MIEVGYDTNNITKKEYTRGSREYTEALEKLIEEKIISRVTSPNCIGIYSDGAYSLYTSIRSVDVPNTIPITAGVISIMIDPEGNKTYKWYERGNTSSVENKDAVATGKFLDNDNKFTLYFSELGTFYSIYFQQCDYIGITFLNGKEIKRANYSVCR